MQSVSGAILQAFEQFIQRHVVVTLYLTMLVGAGGNAGNQAAVLVIRGLACGKIESQKAPLDSQQSGSNLAPPAKGWSCSSRRRSEVAAVWCLFPSCKCLPLISNRLVSLLFQGVGQGDCYRILHCIVFGFGWIWTGAVGAG